MSDKTIKVDKDIHNEVVLHTIKNGSKIGKFYDIAAKEKLERDTKKEKQEYTGALPNTN